MALYESEDILYVAQTLRPYLDAILGDQEAEETGAELDQLLARAKAGEDVDNLILAELVKYPTTRAWIQQALVVTNGVRLKYDPQPGKSSPAPATSRFVCPVVSCKFEWTRRHVGMGVPPCPDHNRPLELADPEH